MPTAKRSSSGCAPPPARAGSAMTSLMSVCHGRCRPRPTASCTRRSTTSPVIAAGNNRRLPQAQRTVAGWTVKAVRNEPWLLVFMLPVLVITLTLAAIGMMVWFVFLIAVLALGHTPRHADPPVRPPAPGPDGPRARLSTAGSPAPAGAGSDARRHAPDLLELQLGEPQGSSGNPAPSYVATRSATSAPPPAAIGLRPGAPGMLNNHVTQTVTTCSTTRLPARGSTATTAPSAQPAHGANRCDSSPSIRSAPR